MDDDYLLRMQRDRDEILEIQRQIEKLNNPATHSEPSYNDGYDYDGILRQSVYLTSQL